MASTWETLEERERRVRGTRTTTAMARAAEQVPEGKTLRAAFAERPFINREDLKTIARQHYERPVITFYLNFAPERLVRADPPVFVSVFHSLRHQALEARKAHLEALPRDQRLGVPEDLRRAVSESADPQHHGGDSLFSGGRASGRIQAALTTSTSFSVQYHRQSAYSLCCVQNKKGLAFAAWFFLGA